MSMGQLCGQRHLEHPLSSVPVLMAVPFGQKLGGGEFAHCSEGISELLLTVSVTTTAYAAVIENNINSVMAINIFIKTTLYRFNKSIFILYQFFYNHLCYLLIFIIGIAYI